MATLSEAMRLALRLTREGDVGQAGKVIRTALGGAGTVPPTPAADPGEPLPCFAPPQDFGEAVRKLVGLRRAPGSHGAPEASQRIYEVGHGRFEAGTSTCPSGTRAYKLFVPEAAIPAAGLLVMLHGCTQDPDDFAAGTGMNRLAEARGWLVLYPEQPRSANANRCWNWFEGRDQRREAGEPAILATMTRSIVERFGVPHNHVFVAGLSAGGAMAAILAETYPDLFAAVGIHSGLPYAAASDVASAFAAMRSGPSPSHGTAGRQRSIPAIVFHGDTDRTVNEANADAIVARLQTDPALTLERSEGRAPAGRAFVRTVGRDQAGAVRYERWTLRGGGHAWSGGTAAGSYTDPQGPDASAEMLRFFDAVSGPGD